MLVAGGALAQSAAPRPVPIRDNSFLVEEAYNQERGVVQHINTLGTSNLGQGWDYSFTQEWPVRSMRHQLSYTIPVVKGTFAGENITSVTNVALNYRFQAVGANGEPTAFAPRVSLLLPPGSDEAATGATGGTGIQVNLPFSFELGDRVVSHTNVGTTYTPSFMNTVGDEAMTTAWSAGQSLIWLVHPKFNLMLEGTVNRMRESDGAGGMTWVTEKIVSPGFRAAFDFASGLQVVPGIAVPISVGSGSSERSMFFYLSFEHPFSKEK